MVESCGRSKLQILLCLLIEEHCDNMTYAMVYLLGVLCLQVVLEIFGREKEDFNSVMTPVLISGTEKRRY